MDCFCYYAFNDDVYLIRMYRKAKKCVFGDLIIMWLHHYNHRLRHPGYCESTDGFWLHCSDVIMSMMPSQFISVAIVYSTICWRTGQRKQWSSASLAFVRGIHRWPANSPHEGPVTRRMFPFDDIITDQQFSLALERGISDPKFFTQIFVPLVS